MPIFVLLVEAVRDAVPQYIGEPQEFYPYILHEMQNMSKLVPIDLVLVDYERERERERESTIYNNV